MGTRAVVGTVVVVGLLAGGAYAADVVLRGQAEDQVAAELQAQIPGLDAAPEVTVGGFPFLTQLLAGELDDVHVTAPSATVDGLLLEDVDVRITDLTTGSPTTAAAVDLTAYTSLESMTAALDLPLALAIDGQNLVATTDILGMQIEVLLLPRAAGREIVVDVDAFRVGGATVSADDLPGAVTAQLQGLTFPVEGLPVGIELTDVRLDAGGAHLTAHGTDVVLDVPAG